MGKGTEPNGDCLITMGYFVTKKNEGIVIARKELTKQSRF